MPHLRRLRQLPRCGSELLCGAHPHRPAPPTRHLTPLNAITIAMLGLSLLTLGMTAAILGSLMVLGGLVLGPIAAQQAQSPWGWVRVMGIGVVLAGLGSGLVWLAPVPTPMPSLATSGPRHTVPRHTSPSRRLWQAEKQHHCGGCRSRKQHDALVDFVAGPFLYATPGRR